VNPVAKEQLADIGRMLLNLGLIVWNFYWLHWVFPGNHDGKNLLIVMATFALIPLEMNLLRRISTAREPIPLCMDCGYVHRGRCKGDHCRG
jgi:hypothetical protein